MIVIPPLSRWDRELFGELFGTGGVSGFYAIQLAELIATPWSPESDEVAAWIWHMQAKDRSDHLRRAAFMHAVRHHVPQLDPRTPEFPPTKPRPRRANFTVEERAP